MQWAPVRQFVEGSEKGTFGAFTCQMMPVGRASEMEPSESPIVRGVRFEVTEQGLQVSSPDGSAIRRLNAPDTGSFLVPWHAAPGDYVIADADCGFALKIWRDTIGQASLLRIAIGIIDDEADHVRAIATRRGMQIVARWPSTVLLTERPSEDEVLEAAAGRKQDGAALQIRATGEAAA